VVGHVAGGELLGSDLLCGEEATARTARTSHGVFVTRFMEIWLEIDYCEQGDGGDDGSITLRCLERRCNSSSLVLATLRLRMRKYCFAFT